VEPSPRQSEMEGDIPHEQPGHHPASMHVTNVIDHGARYPQVVVQPCDPLDEGHSQTRHVMPFPSNITFATQGSDLSLERVDEDWGKGATHKQDSDREDTFKKAGTDDMARQSVDVATPDVNWPPSKMRSSEVVKMAPIRAKTAAGARGLVAAEAVFFRAAAALFHRGKRGEEALAQLRRDPAYIETLALMKKLEDEVSEVLEARSEKGWWLATRFQLNVEAIAGVAAQVEWEHDVGEEGDIVQVFAKVSGRNRRDLELRVLWETSAVESSGMSFLQAYVSLWQEFDLSYTWNTSITKYGIKLLLPQARDSNLLEECTSGPFRRRNSQIFEEHNYFVPEEGLFYHSQVSLNPNDPRCKQEPPAGYTRQDGTTRRNLIICQASSNIMVHAVSMKLPCRLPRFVLQRLIERSAKATVHRMLRSGLEALVGGHHNHRIEADRLGIYSALERVAAAGAKCEEKRGRKFRLGAETSMDGLPHPSIIRERAHSLVALEAAMDTEDAVAAVNHLAPRASSVRHSDRSGTSSRSSNRTHMSRLSRPSTSRMSSPRGTIRRSRT